MTFIILLTYLSKTTKFIIYLIINCVKMLHKIEID